MLKRDPVYLQAWQVCEIFGIRDDQIRNWVAKREKNGLDKVIVKRGKNIFFPHDRIIEWLRTKPRKKYEIESEQVIFDYLRNWTLGVE